MERVRRLGREEKSRNEREGVEERSTSEGRQREE